jgi:hypothetical protein
MILWTLSYSWNKHVTVAGRSARAEPKCTDTCRSTACWPQYRQQYRPWNPSGGGDLLSVSGGMAQLCRRQLTLQQAAAVAEPSS